MRTVYVRPAPPPDPYSRGCEEGYWRGAAEGRYRRYNEGYRRTDEAGVSTGAAPYD